MVKKIPNEIRVSSGSAIVLELLTGKSDAMPTTAYFLTYRKGKCIANCRFCPQARESSGRADMLSRVSWPVFSTRDVLVGIDKAVRNGAIKRVCLQALSYPKVFTHLSALANAIHSRAKVPISVSCQPLNRESIRLLSEAGAERMGISLDAATKELFDKVKGRSAGGPYRWEKELELLGEALSIFGRGMVTTHLIVGLGETEKEMIEIIQRCADMDVLPALFAFTPIPGTALENSPPPSVPQYRRVQLARHLIVNGLATSKNMGFNEEGNVIDFDVEKGTLIDIVQTGDPFLTSGCPNCNRPYYNERPGGPIYNYPRKLTGEEILDITKQLGLV
ncbi:radical SAM protein [Candidatus Bathyarchaeota archaeon]|nr:radical SAM protein [Candidatus Bathyarchaeota archaeon]